MNRRERRYGRMYLLPLLLALTGLALLPLEWVLRLEGFDAFGELAQVMRLNWYIVIYPVILMFLYIFRIPPKVARILAYISLALALFQLGVVFCYKSQSPNGFLSWVPGCKLLSHIQALQLRRSAQNILLTCADACFLLCNLSAVFTCLIYADIKAKSDRRNAEFDRRNAYLTRRTVQEEPTQTVDPILDEPTQIVELPPQSAKPAAPPKSRKTKALTNRKSYGKLQKVHTGKRNDRKK